MSLHYKDFPSVELRAANSTRPKLPKREHPHLPSDITECFGRSFSHDIYFYSPQIAFVQAKCHLGHVAIGRIKAEEKGGINRQREQMKEMRNKWI